jgi:uncharacterized protein (TIGR03437 family)
MKKSALLAFVLSAVAALPMASPLKAQAPTFDISGNRTLNGQYYFRQMIYVVSTNPDPSTGIEGDITRAVAVYGNITFDGNGNYTVTGGASGGVVSDSGFGAPTPLSCYLQGAPCASGAAVKGTYSISASGYGFLSGLITKDLIYGTVSANGIFTGSSTETQSANTDMFIAAPLASPLPGNSTFQGSYTVTAYLPGGDPSNTADAFFQMNADGNGNLGTVNISGYYGGGGTTPIAQTATNVKYIFSNGAAVVTFPNTGTENFFSGAMYLYFSPDGTFFFGGSPAGGFDMVVGVRNGGNTQNFGGLYDEVGLEQDVSQAVSSGFVNFDSFYGSFKTTSDGQIIAHDRLNSVFNSATLGSTYADSFTQPVGATYTDKVSSYQYAVGTGGTVRIGAGIWPFLGISVAVQAPTFTPAGAVYIDPTGIVNAASFSPFTAGITNGQFIAIFGTNLAPKTTVASTLPFPTNLGGVQVLVNGVAAPIYFVSTGQLVVITPAANPFALAQIQVLNNNVASNVVTVPVYQTAPGVYGGIGYAAAEHSNFQVITPSNPALPGETIQVFVTGLGTVFPPVPDGAAAPSDTLSSAVNTISAAVGGTSAQVAFAGLTPTAAGLAQVNLTIPSNLAAGDYNLAIAGAVPVNTGGTNPDSYTSESLISVGKAGVATAARKPAAEARKRPAANRTAPAKRRLCLPAGNTGCSTQQAEMPLPSRSRF